MATPRLGAKATAMSSTLEGRWLNTMQLSSPTLSANRGAARNEAVCRHPQGKEDDPQKPDRGAEAHG